LQNLKEFLQLDKGFCTLDTVDSKLKVHYRVEVLLDSQAVHDKYSSNREFPWEGSGTHRIGIFVLMKPL